MTFIETTRKDVFILEPKVFVEHRGFFMESWSEVSFQKQGFSTE